MEYYERLLIAQEALDAATKGRGIRAGDAPAYTGAMQATLAKIGMRKSSFRVDCILGLFKGPSLLVCGFSVAQ